MKISFSNFIAWLLTNPVITIGMAGRITPNDVFTEDENPMYGFYWWFWKPFGHWNHGRADRGEVVDGTLHWLCFWVSITSWPKKFNKGYIKERIGDIK